MITQKEIQLRLTTDVAAWFRSMNLRNFAILKKYTLGFYVKSLNGPHHQIYPAHTHIDDKTYHNTRCICFYVFFFFTCFSLLCSSFFCEEAKSISVFYWYVSLCMREISFFGCVYAFSVIFFSTFVFLFFSLSIDQSETWYLMKIYTNDIFIHIRHNIAKQIVWFLSIDTKWSNTTRQGGVKT